jgi:hypothetical protein
MKRSGLNFWKGLDTALSRESRPESTGKNPFIFTTDRALMIFQRGLIILPITQVP